MYASKMCPTKEGEFGKLCSFNEGEFCRSVPPKNESHVRHTSVVNTIAAMGIVPLSVHASPAGRLAYFFKNYEQLTKDLWVLSTVRGIA